MNLRLQENTTLQPATNQPPLERVMPMPLVMNLRLQENTALQPVINQSPLELVMLVPTV